ncbi:MAG: DnaB-like helicase C-terminal domain-containing protein, partial [Pseudomonadota bacterium]
THHGARAALFSLEMGRENTAFRNASRDARIHGKAIVEYRDLRAGTISQRDMAALTEAQRLAQPVNDRFLIDVRAGLTIRQVEARARQARRALGGLDLLCIDYLQLIKGDRDYRGNRYAEVTDISMRLKELAKDLHCPVIALSQLSRQADHRTDHRPVLADLKESGSIEQDADSVVFCYRPEYYLERSEPKGEAASKGPEGDTPWDHWNAELSAARNKLHVIVDKNRHGPVGTEVLHVELASDTITNSMGDLPDIGVFL